MSAPSHNVKQPQLQHQLYVIKCQVKGISNSRAVYTFVKEGESHSVRKVVSRSKFIEHILMLQAEQNFQMCAQIILLLRAAEQFMQHLPFFNIALTVFTPSKSVRAEHRV